MSKTDEPTLLTDEVKALIGQETELEEMYGVVDTETVRRYIIGIPDQDPRHWDEELASPRFGGTSTPPMMVHYISNRKPPWEEDEMSEIMAKDPFSDGGGGMGRKESSLTPIRDVAPTRSHLHAGDEVELFQYPKIGDRIFYKSRWVDFQEKRGRDGKPFLLTVRETSYLNQDNALLLKVRGIGIERP